MRWYLILLLVTLVALAGVQGRPKKKPRKKPSMFLKPKNRCAVRAILCSGRSRPGICRARPIRPSCPPFFPFYRPCRQSIRPVRHVWLRRAKRFLCCKVLNCPAIFMSVCSGFPERCRVPYGVCMPRRYKRQKLKVVCPDRKKPYLIYRYLPQCCTCARCRNGVSPKRRKKGRGKKGRGKKGRGKKGRKPK